MSAIENMVRVVLSAMDIDVEEIKGVLMERVNKFEENVVTLNTTLIDLLKEQRRNAAMMEAVLTHLNLPVPPPTAPSEKSNDARLIN